MRLLFSIFCVSLLAAGQSYAINWDDGGRSLDAPLDTTDDHTWNNPENWGSNASPFDDEIPAVGASDNNAFLNFTDPEIIVDAVAPALSKVFLACRDDGRPVDERGGEKMSCLNQRTQLSIVEGGEMNVEWIRTGAFGAGHTVLEMSGNARVNAEGGLQSNSRNTLDPAAFLNELSSEISLTGNAVYHTGNRLEIVSDEVTGIIAGPGQTVINLSGDAQLIAPGGILTGGDGPALGPSMPLLDPDLPREGNNRYDDFSFEINISDNATLAVLADEVDDLLADIYLGSGLIKGDGITHQLVPDGIELTERDADGLFSVVEIADARVFFVESTGLAEDFNGNGTVDFADFVMFSNVFGQDVPPGDPKFDLDMNGNIGFSDFVTFSVAFGNSANVASVPEPTGLTSVCLGLFTLLSMLKRKALRN